MCEGCTAAKGNTDYCGYLANGGKRCLSWCNIYTCASHPTDCGTCAGGTGDPNCLNPSTHCEKWSVRTLPSYLPPPALKYVRTPSRQPTPDTSFDTRWIPLRHPLDTPTSHP